MTFFESGKIHEDARDKSVRLNVTANCYLVLKKVTVQDAGFYYCRQFDTSGKQVSGSGVHLSVTESEYLHLSKPKLCDNNAVKPTDSIVKPKC